MKVDNISKSEAEDKADGEMNDRLVGMMAGELVWMMFPGAMAIKDFIQSALGSIAPMIGGVFGLFMGATADIALPNIEPLKLKHGWTSSFIGMVKGKAIGDALQPIWVVLSYWFTTILMKWTFAMIPILVFSVAALVAFISYLVTLCKYFYISPFVTAWAMATKRTDKIIDFLLMGISVFLRPILIVLFVYLALFMYVLVDEFFIFVAT